MPTISERVQATRERIAQRRAARRAGKPDRVQEKQEAERVRLEHKRNTDLPGGGGL